MVKLKEIIIFFSRSFQDLTPFCYNGTMKKIILFFAGCALLVSSATANVCRVLTVEGVIDPVIAEYVKDSLSENNFDIAVIALNTPGGLMDSMQDIVKEMMNCPKPVGVWVGPSGARRQGSL